MQNKTKLFKTAICIITTLILIFGTIPCGAVLSDESNAPTYTNLVVFMKFSDEDEFINNTYADTTVRNILDNTYNKSVYNVADYFKTVSGGKMNMQTLYLFDNNNSLTLSKPRGYYAEKDDQNPYGYESEEKNFRMYELQTDWANTISNAITNGNKPKDIEENQYNFADLDRNHDGKIDLITVIYKNTTQNISVSWNSPLWDYHSYSNMISVQEGVNTYQSGEYLQLTCNYENVNGLMLYRGEDNLPILPTGKICHETMHALGLKDLYRSNQTSAVYYMSLMAKHLTLSDSIFPLKNANLSVGLTIIKLKLLIKTVHTHSILPQLKMKLLHINEICRTEKLFIWNIVNLMTMVTNMIQKTRNSIRAIPVT